jgi:regulator of cell morphogenesis and NO signaling
MIDLRRTVADAVLDHSECASVFERHGIDFCCGGQRSIAQACLDAGVPSDVLEEELARAVLDRCEDADDVRKLTTQQLVGRIVDRHHAYLRKTLPFVCQLANKVARVHGERERQLVEIADTVRTLGDVLLPHLEQEERELFPRMLDVHPGTARLHREIAEMREEHELVGRMLDRLRRVSHDFTVPPWACNSYRTLFSELVALERDIHVHVHLENNVLAPRFAA